MKTGATNDIIKRQNEGKFILLLKAMRVAYSQSKLFQIIDFITILIAIALPLAKIFGSFWINWFDVVAFIFLILYLITEKLRSSKAKLGAKIQEEFDVELFHIDWNDELCGEKATNEDKLKLSKKYKKKDLENWYSVEIKNLLPNNIAVLLCQRINLSWEISLKERFCKLLINFLVIYYLVFIGYFVYININIKEAILLLIPSAPFLAYVFFNYSNISEQIKSKKETRTSIDSDWENYVNNREQIPETQKLRRYQNKIFTNRSKPERIPDWYYNSKRKKDELTTDELIKYMLQEL